MDEDLNLDQEYLNMSGNYAGSFVGDEQFVDEVAELDNDGTDSEEEEEFFELKSGSGASLLNNQHMPNAFTSSINSESDDDRSFLTDDDDDENKEVTGATGSDEEASPVTHSEHVRLIHLQRFLDKLAQIVQDKQQAVQQTQEELITCKTRIEQLESERDETYKEMQVADGDGNVAAVYRLKAKHERLCEELVAEVELEQQISKTLDEARVSHKPISHCLVIKFFDWWQLVLGTK